MFNNTNPLKELTDTLCQKEGHRLVEMKSGVPNDEVVEFLLAPEPGHGCPHGPDYPFVAWVKTGCRLPDECRMFFSANEYIGGKADGFVRLFATNMLPWHEWAIGKYMLPDGWSINNWVIKSPDGTEWPYEHEMSVYDDGRVVYENDIDINARLEELSAARRRVNYYVSHVTSTTEDGRDSRAAIDSKASAVNVMRNLIVPANIESTSRSLVYGYNNGQEMTDAKSTRQALQAYIAMKAHLPIMVIEEIYNLPD